MQKNHWFRTYAFRKFKEELTVLSRLHWTFAYSAQVTLGQLNIQPDSNNDFIPHLLSAAQFDHARYHITKTEFRESIQPLLDHHNLLLLVKACANFEDFLHRFVTLWAVSQGHESPIDSGKLGVVGNAIIAPAMKSNIAGSLDYIESLISCNPDSYRDKFSKAYLLRNLAAHNGGVCDWDTAKKLQQADRQPGSRIHLKWDELCIYLEAMEKTAVKLETHLTPEQRKNSETRLLIRQIVLKTPTTSENEVKRIMVETYGYQRLPPRKRLAQIIKAVAETPN